MEHNFVRVHVHMKHVNVRVNGRIRMHMYLYHTCHRGAGTLFHTHTHTHTHNGTRDFTLVNQPSRGLLSFHALLWRSLRHCHFFFFFFKLFNITNEKCVSTRLHLFISLLTKEMEMPSPSPFEYDDKWNLFHRRTWDRRWRARLCRSPGSPLSPWSRCPSCSAASSWRRPGSRLEPPARRNRSRRCRRSWGCSSSLISRRVNFWSICSRRLWCRWDYTEKEI